MFRAKKITIFMKVLKEIIPKANSILCRIQKREEALSTRDSKIVKDNLNMYVGFCAVRNLI